MIERRDEPILHFPHDCCSALCGELRRALGVEIPLPRSRAKAGRLPSSPYRQPRQICKIYQSDKSTTALAIRLPPQPDLGGDGRFELSGTVRAPRSPLLAFRTGGAGSQLSSYPPTRIDIAAKRARQNLPCPFLSPATSVGLDALISVVVFANIFPARPIVVLRETCRLREPARAYLARQWRGMTHVPKNTHSWRHRLIMCFGFSRRFMVADHRRGIREGKIDSSN